MGKFKAEKAISYLQGHAFTVYDPDDLDGEVVDEFVALDAISLATEETVDMVLAQVLDLLRKQGIGDEDYRELFINEVRNACL